jgi:hypothetical protein
MSQLARAFGADHRPACPECSLPMHVSRRSPHPDHGRSYEIQILTCLACKSEITRGADKDGQPYYLAASVGAPRGVIVDFGCRSRCRASLIGAIVDLPKLLMEDSNV